MMRHTLSVLLWAAALALPPAARANTGDLDPAFGTGGQVVTPIFNGYDVASALVLQPDGKLVAAGHAYNASNTVFALVRYNTDGSLDGSFGTGGKVTTAIGTGSGATALVLQPDGKLVAAGYASSAGKTTFALVRYNASGSLDASFGTGGKVTTPIGSVDDEAFALVLEPDGKLVAAGYSDRGSNNAVALVRYNANGSLDTSFGTGGKVTTAIGSVDDEVFALVLQPDGKLVAAGYTSGANSTAFALVRYNADGSLDTGFGTGGKGTTAIGSIDDEAFALVLQPDGKLVAAGYSSGASNTAFARQRAGLRPRALQRRWEPRWEFRHGREGHHAGAGRLRRGQCARPSTRREARRGGLLVQRQRHRLRRRALPGTGLRRRHRASARAVR
ncbi:MAG: hypothetical protein E6J68_11440 [Deltaproteobacteria bacterium]|nr:MAG: hypothetical protein E6J68_11440 [Deltaproteobacteria bacterium]